jgi:hypothetical protein
MKTVNARKYASVHPLLQEWLYAYLAEFTDARTDCGSLIATIVNYLAIDNKVQAIKSLREAAQDNVITTIDSGNMMRNIRNDQLRNSLSAAISCTPYWRSEDTGFLVNSRRMGLKEAKDFIDCVAYIMDKVWEEQI